MSTIDTVELTELEQQVLTTLREIVAEKGEEYVYVVPGEGHSCVYFYDGKPSCLIGHLIDRLGWNSAPIGLLSPHDLPPEASDRLFFALQHAQIAQDSKRTWGHALQVFEAELAAAR